MECWSQQHFFCLRGSNFNRLLGMVVRVIGGLWGGQTFGLLLFSIESVPSNSPARSLSFEQGPHVYRVVETPGTATRCSIFAQISKSDATQNWVVRFAL